MWLKRPGPFPGTLRLFLEIHVFQTTSSSSFYVTIYGVYTYIYRIYPVCKIFRRWEFLAKVLIPFKFFNFFETFLFYHLLIIKIPFSRVST